MSKKSSISEVLFSTTCNTKTEADAAMESIQKGAGLLLGPFEVEQRDNMLRVQWFGDTTNDPNRVPLKQVYLTYATKAKANRMYDGLIDAEDQDVSAFIDWALANGGSAEAS